MHLNCENFNKFLRLFNMIESLCFILISSSLKILWNIIKTKIKKKLNTYNDWKTQIEKSESECNARRDELNSFLKMNCYSILFVTIITTILWSLFTGKLIIKNKFFKNLMRLVQQPSRPSSTHPQVLAALKKPKTI
jgi:hypothetical protein